MFGLSTLPQLEAEAAYRRERITHDWAAANGTQRTLVRRLRRLARWVTAERPVAPAAHARGRIAS